MPITQAEARLFHVFWRFLNTFASIEHPLVLFVDDLQWVDSASLRLLHNIIEDQDTQYLLVVGAYLQT
jgi:predicted ATPase